MTTTKQTIAMQYVDLNAKLLVANIKSGYCIEEVNEQYAKALELLEALLDLKVSNMKSYDKADETDEDRNRRRSIAKNNKLELISLITQL